MSAPRLPDWSMRLQRVVQARLREPFAWGGNDCCLFAADCVLACTGRDPAAGMRGAYRSERQALRLLRRFGGVEGLAQAHLAGEILPAMAQRGDVGLLEREDGRCVLVVCNGAQWLGPTPQGMTQVDMPSRAWRVAHG